MSARVELAAAPVRRFGIVRLGQPAAITLAVLIICVVMALISEPFRSYDNLYNDSRNFGFVAIMGMGQMLVIITGGIDLSVGSVMGLVGIVTGLTLQAGISVVGRGRRGNGGCAALRPHQRLRDRQVQAVAIRRDADHAVGRAQPGADPVQQQNDLSIRTGRETVRLARRRQSVRHPLRRHRDGADRRRPHDRLGQHKLGPIRLRDRRQRAGGAADRHSCRAGQGLRLRHQQPLGRHRRHSDGRLARIRHQWARRRLRASGHRRDGHRRHRSYGRLRHSLCGGDRRGADRNRAQRAPAGRS